GHAADRYSRKLLVLLSLGTTALASLGLATLSFLEGPVPLVYLCLLLIGISRAFSMPARSALVPQVVPADALGNAITWNSSGWQIASMVGPALAGLVLQVTAQAGWAYLFSGLGALACAALVASIRPHAPARQREPISLASLLAGLRFVY